MEIRWQLRSSIFPRVYERVGGRESPEGVQILRRVQAQQADSSGLGQFFGGGVHGLAGMEHLRDGCGRQWDCSSGCEALKIASALPMARSSLPAMRVPSRASRPARIIRAAD
jgi:hypothetical protein